MGKRFTLLSAYEALTEKETFCIKEANFDEIRKIQTKKSKLLRELEGLEDQYGLGEAEKDDFNSRIERLQIEEKENEERLADLMKQNRTEFKSLSKQTRSVSRIRKAYGSASSPDDRKRSLKDRA